MEYRVTIDIDAPPERVWAVLVDVERWPEWTDSMQRVELVDGGPLAVGSRARVKQPRLPALEWEVTDLEPGRSFTWAASGPGQRTVAVHRIEPVERGSRVTLELEQRGFLAQIFGRLFAGTTRRYVNMEAQGLKRASEGRAAEGTQTGEAPAV